MRDADGVILVLTTVDHEDKATAFARGLVEERLAACVTRLPAGLSMYRFESEEITIEAEFVLLIKTHRDKLAALEEHFKTHHPYSVPELLVFPAGSVAEGYRQWLMDELLAQ